MKNIEKWIIIVLSVIAAVAIGTAIYLVINKQDVVDDKEIYGIINNKAYTLDEIKKEYGNDFIKIIKEDKIVIFNGETTYGCIYNKLCEIWPDSDNGNIMWSAPLVTITFKKGDITEAEIVSSDNELDDEDKVIDLKAKELMELYISPIICEFEGKYTDELKTLVLINNVETNKIADCKKIYGNDIKPLEDSGYEVIEGGYIGRGTICEEDSTYYDIETLKEESIELFGKDIITRKGIANFSGGYYDYVKKEDAFVYLSCRCGDICDSNYEILSYRRGNNKYYINFSFNASFYSMVFDIDSNEHYTFNSLLEYQQ